MEIEEVKEEEEKPCYILSIPNELQIMIFDRMEPKDKHCYGQSSRKCREIWKNSKCLYDGFCWQDSILDVRLSLNDSYPFTGNRQFIYFYRDFRDYEIGHNNDITQTGKMKEGEHFLEIAKKKFVDKLEKYQNTVKSITIKGTCLFDLRNIQSYPNLQYLIIYGIGDSESFQEFLSKSGNELKYLNIGTFLSKSYAEFPQIYRVREYLSIDFRLNREQLLSLSARNIKMPMGDLKPKDISEFIRTWQNGSRILKRCEWSYCNNFDARTFFGFFNVQMTNDNYKRISIRGIGSARAMITWNKSVRFLLFEVIENPNLDENIDSDG